jgi:hypothetical protein
MVCRPRRFFVFISGEFDLSAEGVHMLWLTVPQMVSESVEMEPGRSVLINGFIPIGACAHGSGDPYFINMLQSTDDPAVHRLPHDFLLNGVYPLDKMQLVSPNLSKFFHDALIKTLT